MIAEKNAKSMKRPDFAIQQRIIDENNLYNAEFYDKKMKLLGINAGWFEKNKKFEVSKNKKIHEGKIRNELSLNNQAVKMVRREKLRQLYLQELNQYEQELNSKGLSIVKER